MKIFFELSDKEKLQLKLEQTTEIDLCVRYETFFNEFIEDFDKQEIDKVLEMFQEQYADFSDVSELEMIKHVIYHPQIKYRVKVNGRGDRFNKWYDELLQYIEYSCKICRIYATKQQRWNEALIRIRDAAQAGAPGEYGPIVNKEINNSDHDLQDELFKFYKKVGYYGLRYVVVD